MPLRRLTALEVDKLRSELAELQETIAELESILADPQRRWTIIKDELGSIRSEFANERKSRIIPDEGELSLEDLIADDELIITVSATGYVKSVPASTYAPRAGVVVGSRPPRSGMTTWSATWSTPPPTPTCCSSPTRVWSTGSRPTRSRGNRGRRKGCSPRRCSPSVPRSASRR